MSKILNLKDHNDEIITINNNISNMSAKELEALTNSISVLNSLLSIDSKIGDETLTTIATSIIGAINELKTQITTLQQQVTALQQSAGK